MSALPKGFVSKCVGISLLAGLALHLCPQLAQAQEGFALDRFDPSERGSRWFAADSLDIAGSNRFALGIVGDIAHKPLVLQDADGNDVAPVIRDQFFVHVGGAITFIDRIRVGLNVPILAYQRANDVVLPTGPVSPSDSATVGDIRGSVDVRLLGRTDDPLTVAVGVRFYLPTGSTEAFTSDGVFSMLPRAQAAGRLGAFVYSANTGVRIRGREADFGAEPIGSEVVLGGALGIITYDDRLVLGPEVWSSSVITGGSDAFLGRTTTPFEASMGAHLDVVENLRVGLGVGPGLSRGMGAPAARYLVSVEWVPGVEKVAPPPSDRDGDAIEDSADACPDVPGVPNASADLNGCPLPVIADTDGDGILDDSDACPAEAGRADLEHPKLHGCPLPPDGDGDGIADEADACPAEAGPPNSIDPSKNGCPPPSDSDGDGIVDPQDACPKEPGSPSDNPKRNGCPRAVLTESGISILERVEFETGEAILRPESSGVLSAVATVLKDHPEIKKISVEGHTDSRGAAQFNLQLSRRRAASVVTWLVKNGIEASRLVSAGYGSERPLRGNDTEEERQENRRVEFKVVGGDSSAVAN